MFLTLCNEDSNSKPMKIKYSDDQISFKSNPVTWDFVVNDGNEGVDFILRFQL